MDALPDRPLKAATSMTRYSTLDNLLTAIRACRVCEAHLPLGPRPILRASATARILIVGQAPGARVHATGIPWDDPSGERLRRWMGIEKDEFYDESLIALVPMGYCYPGRGGGGDLPPRQECADLWLPLLLGRLPRIELTLLVGAHAQKHFLGRRRKSTLAETIRHWREFGPHHLPLPHPSPRNTPWFRRHAWFEHQLLPELRARVKAIRSQSPSKNQPALAVTADKRRSRK